MLSSPSLFPVAIFHRWPLRRMSRGPGCSRHQLCSWKEEFHTFSTTVTWSFELLSSRPSKRRKVMQNVLHLPPLGKTVTKGMMLNRDYATDLEDFHTQVSEAATRCPPGPSRCPVQNGNALLLDFLSRVTHEPSTTFQIYQRWRVTAQTVK